MLVARAIVPGTTVQQVGDQTVDIHVFDDRNAGRDHMHCRHYTFERHESWAFSSGIDFYQGPSPNQRAALREKGGKWHAVFWERS